MLRCHCKGLAVVAADQPPYSSQAKNNSFDIKFESHPSFPGSRRHNKLLLLASKGSIPKDST